MSTITTTTIPHDAIGSSEVPEFLVVDDLKMHFAAGGSGFLNRRKRTVHAVDGVSFSIAKGETLGLVGESGCGKSTLGRAILQLYRPTSGQVNLEGHELTTLTGGELRRSRRRMQMIFQDPYASLDPRMTVGQIIGESLRIHGLHDGSRRERVLELLDLVGLNPKFIDRYPHEFSGGQRQRIGIARAVAVEPEFIVCDEPVSALDVSVQAQIINLLEDLQERLGLTYLFVAHDLAVVRQISDRVAVMYVGKMVELSERSDLYENPLHPYTKALLSAVPVPDPRLEKLRERIILTGDVPSPVNPAAGCRFASRCPFAIERCRQEEPVLTEVRAGHSVACHRWEELAG